MIQLMLRRLGNNRRTRTYKTAQCFIYNPFLSILFIVWRIELTDTTKSARPSGRKQWKHMTFDIAKAKTRAIACGAVLIAATALSSYFSIGLGGTLFFSTLATITSNLASGVAANDLGDWAKQFRQNERILNNQHLTQVVGLAISLVILDAMESEELLELVEREGLPYPQDALQKLADKVVEYWPMIARDKAGDKDYVPIQESKLVAMFAQDVQTFRTVKALEPRIWEYTLSWLAKASEVSLPQAVIHHIAEKLYNDFPQRLRDVLKHDAAKEGEAFAAMVLDLQGEALSLLKQVLLSNQTVVKELDNVAKRQDLRVVYRQMILSFRDISAQIYSSPKSILKNRDMV